MLKRINKLFLILALPVVLAGCSSFNAEQVRQEQAINYPKQLSEKTAEIVAQYQSLDLNDCINIALENNLDLKIVEIKQKLSQLEKNVSFANFLPSVSVGYDKHWFDPQPQIKFGSSGLPMQDKEVAEFTVNVQWSIFNPVTWFMYSMYKHGYEIAELSTQYTQQAIILQITAQYYQCLALEKMQSAMQSHLDAAIAVQKQMQALFDESIISQWQLEQAKVLVLARQTQLQSVEKSIRQAKSELMAGMGLNPLDDVTLESQSPFEAPDISLEELITEALMNNISMAISDRLVEIEREKIHAAVTAFLPILAGYATRIDTTDSHQVFTDYWLGGLSATIKLFDGLANVNYFKAAKVLHQESRISREQATLTLMIQVIRAFDQAELAQNQIELTDQIEKTTKMHLKQMQQHYEQGLVQAGDMLTMTAQADEAEIQSIQARYQYQTCIAVLNNLTGRKQVEIEESTNDAR